MAQTKTNSKQITKSIWGADLIDDLGLYDETANYIIDNVVFRKLQYWKANINITWWIEWDYSNAPDLNSNWNSVYVYGWGNEIHTFIWNTNIQTIWSSENILQIKESNWNTGFSVQTNSWKNYINLKENNLTLTSIKSSWDSYINNSLFIWNSINTSLSSPWILNIQNAGLSQIRIEDTNNSSKWTMWTGCIETPLIDDFFIHSLWLHDAPLVIEKNTGNIRLWALTIKPSTTANSLLIKDFQWDNLMSITWASASNVVIKIWDINWTTYESIFTVDNNNGIFHFMNGDVWIGTINPQDVVEVNWAVIRTGFISLFAYSSQNVTNATSIERDQNNRTDTNYYTHNTSTNSDEITINKEWRYRVSVDISTDVTSPTENRSNSKFHLELYNGVSRWTIKGTTSYMYNRMNANWENTGSMTTIIISQNNNQKVRVVAERIAGTDTISTITGGCRINIEKI